MNTYRQIIENDGVRIPCIMIEPTTPIGAAVIIHGYGGCKEEQLGLAWRIAEIGFATCTIDISGHGQHDLPLGKRVLLDVNSAINYCRRFGKVVAVGHSLGGRLAMVSNADYSIGISPAIVDIFRNQTRENLKNLRSYRVKNCKSENFLEVFKQLPMWVSSKNKPTLILYASRDISEIISACNKISEKNIPVINIENALHNDIYLNEITFEKINNQLQQWFK